MNVFKYMSVMVLVLGSASCWGMKRRVALTQPLSFNDMTITHTRNEFAEGYDEVGEFIYVTYKTGDFAYKIGDLGCTWRDIKKPKHIITKFADRYLSSKNYQKNNRDLCALCEGCKKIIMLDHININDQYQQQGLGRSFFGYFLKHVTDTHTESIVFLRPVQKFAKKEGNLHCSNDELQVRLVNFYKSFGARYLNFSDEWMYILIKK